VAGSPRAPRQVLAAGRGPDVILDDGRVRAVRTDAEFGLGDTAAARQESFARAAELQEKRDLEHLAFQDLLMLSEDMESGCVSHLETHSWRAEACERRM
jgi:hypothetical protein